MLAIGIALGLVAGLLAGGRFTNLADIRFRRLWLVLVALLIRFGTELLIVQGSEPAVQARLPLFALAYVTLIVGLWPNRMLPGIRLALVGIVANGLVIALNAGTMPVWLPSLEFAGIDPSTVSPTLHTLVGPPIDIEFLVRLQWLGDVVPIPFPVVRNVASIGDVFLAGGLAFFLFYVVTRGVADQVTALGAGARGAGAGAGAAAVAGPTVGIAGATRTSRGLGTFMTPRGVRPETGIADESLRLAGPATMLAGGPIATAPLGEGFGRPALVGAGTGAVTAPSRRGLARAAEHPYVALALNPAFSALWFGQLISLFGDRLTQIALAFLVLESTGSAVAVGLVFAATALPNLLVGPVAGALVDRWDRRDVMVVSDLLRAATVLLIPIAAVTNVALVFVLVLVTATLSTFFRPARTVIVPALVPNRLLLPANSALWIGETIADLAGYPIAGLLVALFGGAIAVAFWLDAATYVASALLLSTIAVSAGRAGRSTERVGTLIGGVVDEVRQGWTFVRRDMILLVNTGQAMVGQFAAGIAIVVTPLLAFQLAPDAGVDGSVAYGLLETVLGAGSLIGGLVLGAVAMRLSRVRLAIFGYVLLGLGLAALGVVGSLQGALVVIGIVGVANMVYVIPSQTLFQERVPDNLMGRVVALRSTLVFGAMTLAMAVGGYVAEAQGVEATLVVFGVVAALAGVGGLLVPAVRRA